MKSFLITLQTLYAIGLIPWFLIWGLTFMGFASGVNWFSATLMLAVSLYPVAVILCTILAWKYRIKRRRAATVANLIPMLWILGMVVPFAVINL